jgi:hypothetical protein
VRLPSATRSSPTPVRARSAASSTDSRRFLVRKPGALAGATALAASRASGAFTGAHQAFWDAARRALGDGPGTRALIGALLLHRTLPAAAVLAGMTAALESGRHDPDLVAVEARRHLAAPTTGPAVALPVAAPPAARADTARAAPSLLGYDELLRDELPRDELLLVTGKATA